MGRSGNWRYCTGRTGIHAEASGGIRQSFGTEQWPTVQTCLDSSGSAQNAAGGYKPGDTDGQDDLAGRSDWRHRCGESWTADHRAWCD
ncbi:hypothetical protein D3C87_1945600 [compost metagenome]